MGKSQGDGESKLTPRVTAAGVLCCARPKGAKCTPGAGEQSEAGASRSSGRSVGSTHSALREAPGGFSASK